MPIDAARSPTEKTHGVGGVGRTSQRRSERLELEPPNPPLSSPPRPKQRFRMQAGGASMFGRVGAGIAALGVVLGTMLGDPGATSNRAVSEPTPIEVTETRTQSQAEATFVSDVVRRASQVFAPFGLDRDEVLRAMTNASISIDLEGTRFGASIHRGGVVLSAQPSLEWTVDWAPDAHIARLWYDFGAATFRAEASGLGPDAIYERIITNKANEHLRSRLPPAMQQPGYSLWSDPDLPQHLEALFELVRASRSGTAQGAPLADGMSNPSVHLSFTVPETRIIPLADSGYSAELKRGTRIDVTAYFEGAVADPRLDDVRISFSDALEIARDDGRHRSGLRKIDIHSATLRPGGQVELDYELGPEQAIDGVRAAITLFVLMAEPRAHIPSFERTRLQSLRGDVQQRIDRELEPRLIDLIQRHDRAVPGLSLVEIFGVPP
jgi:hypothetical protein